MRLINALAIGIVVFSVALGAGLGLLVHGDQPHGQFFRFETFAVQTINPTKCSTIPQTYDNWLGINVIGNRTAMAFQSITVFSTGQNIRIDVPLSNTAFAEYLVTNSTFETIIVPLPNYFSPGNVLTLSLTYSIANFPPTSQTLAETPILQGTISC